MTQIDSSLQQVLRASQKARALGQYNEATVILDDYFNANADACAGITVHIEFALNYLAQGYLKGAHEALLRGLEHPVDLVRDARDPELALFGLLIAVIALRYTNTTTTTNNLNLCHAKCLMVWGDHLRTLKSGGHTDIHVKLEIVMWETLYYILPHWRHSVNHLNVTFMARLVTICRYLCAENRHSEALEVARLRKRVSTFQYADRPLYEEVGLLCCLEVVLDCTEDFCGAASHAHRHIEMRTIQFRLRFLPSSVTAGEELDQEAMYLVSCYEDVDYPKGALFVLQLLLGWRSQRGLGLVPTHVELVRSLEARTGELLPLLELDSIPPSQDPAQRPPFAVREASIHLQSRPVSQGPPTDGVFNRTSAQFGAISQQPFSSERSPNPFPRIDDALNRSSAQFSAISRRQSSFKTNPSSRLLRFVKGDFSEKRLSESRPFSLLETILFAWDITRSLCQRKTIDSITRRKLQVLSERMPESLREFQQTFRDFARLSNADELDPVQTIEVAEATLRANANRPTSESWFLTALSHAMLGHAHRRLHNADMVVKHFEQAIATAENAPGNLPADFAHGMEAALFIAEHQNVMRLGAEVDDACFEATWQKAQTLMQRSGRDKTGLTELMGLLYGSTENPRPRTKTSTKRRGIEGVQDFLLVIFRGFLPSATEEEEGILKEKLEAFEELRQTDQARARSLATMASFGYWVLSHKYTTRALEADPPSIELLHQARLHGQAALGVAECLGVLVSNPRRYALYLWTVGRTWKCEAMALKDPAVYQLALQEFLAAEELLHELRGHQEPTADDILEKLIAKQQFVGQSEVRLIFVEILHCCLLGASCAPNKTLQVSFCQQAWELIQRKKSRSLLDIMSLDACIPVSMLQALRQLPEQNVLLQEEARLVAALRLPSGLPEDRAAIRKHLRSLRNTMKQHVHLNIAMRARDGEGFTVDDLIDLSFQIGNLGNKVVFVDWFTHLDFTCLFIVTADGLRWDMSYHRVNISESTVSTWVRANLKTHILSNNEDAYYRLKEMKELIAPLKSMTMPGDILILCPTAALNHIPLHALEIDDMQILLERNPVAYTPSLSILRHQWHVVKNNAMAMQSHQPWRASVMSVYEDSGPLNPPHEVAAVRDCLSELASMLGTTVESGPHVSVPYFLEHVRGADLIHYHGHAVSGPSAENQALVLNPSTLPSPQDLDHHLTTRRIFTSLTLNRNPLVVNIACASGRQEIRPGDEPFGLTTAFLFAGARTVIGTLWPLKSADGRSFTKLFYKEVREQTKASPRGAIVDVARAVQKAALKIRDVDETEAPYHWASFVVCGLWEYPFGGQIGEFDDRTSTH